MDLIEFILYPIGNILIYGWLYAVYIYRRFTHPDFTFVSHIPCLNNVGKKIQLMDVCAKHNIKYFRRVPFQRVILLYDKEYPDFHARPKIIITSCICCCWCSISEINEDSPWYGFQIYPKFLPAYFPNISSAIAS